MELAKTRSVSGYDIMPSLVNFWQQMLATPGIVAKMAKSYYPMDKKRFIALKTRYRERYDVKQAAQFYITQPDVHERHDVKLWLGSPYGGKV